MKFTNKQEKLHWLKATGIRINEMEQERKIAIIKGEFTKATSLLEGRLFAQREFGKVSRTLK